MRNIAKLVIHGRKRNVMTPNANIVLIAPKNLLTKIPHQINITFLIGGKNMIQLDFFEKDQNLLLWDEIRKVKESSENVRRGVFKRISEFEKIVLEMKEIRLKRDNEFDKMIKEIKEMRETG